ncbi:TPA: hypothetical protein HA251_04405 [Candidatus Woesearchaeota archaeon]|nr:hypothetical protein [Candidatus Woesearchaeota archaeon]
MSATTRASFIITIAAFVLVFLSLASSVDAYESYGYDSQDTLCMRHGCCDCERDDDCDRYKDRREEAVYPAINVFVPDEHENVAFSDLTFEELNEVTMSAYGRSWNDMDALCSSMLMRFGRAGVGCAMNVPDTFIRPVTARAQVSFTILPQTTVFVPAKPIMIVDPVYPPWAPTYNPYW